MFSILQLMKYNENCSSIENVISCNCDKASSLEEFVIMSHFGQLFGHLTVWQIKYGPNFLHSAEADLTEIYISFSKTVK